MIQIDMPMPDNCVECRFNASGFGYCNAMPVNFCGRVNDFEEDGRPEWCPLKAQESVEPTIGGDADGPCGNWWYQCGKCKEAIDYHDKYCRMCGQAVKWE